MNIKALLREVYQQGYNDGFWDMQQSKDPDLYEGDPNAADKFIEKAFSEGGIGNVPLDFWVSVDDDLPNDDVRVLCLLSDRNQSVGYYRRDHGWGWCFDCEDWLQEKVTHWQPLPEPPKA